MSRRGNRLLLFVAMVAAGLLVVVLLSDPLERRQQVVIGDLRAGGAGDGQLKIVDGEKNQATSVSFPGELRFDVMQPVEVAPGRIEERAAYRVHIMSGRPDPEGGAFLAGQPVVTLLDKTTGAETGTLRADDARFETGSSVGGAVAIDFSHMSAQRFSLRGHVEGDFPVADGAPAHLTASRLDVDGSAVSGPGLVTWARPDMTIDGHDMTWDGDTGRIAFRSDAHLTLESTPERRGLSLSAPGGMTWTVPPDAEDPRRAAYGELRGRVTGETSDGSTLETDTLLVDGPTQTLTLLGPSTVTLHDEQAPLTVTSEKLVLQAADTSSRISSDRPVQWSRRGLSGHGTGLDWDKQSGHLHFDSDVQLEFEHAPDGSPATTASATAAAEGRPAAMPWRLSSDGSFDWTMPPGAADPLREGRGEVRGNVRGGNAEASFQTELLRVDGQACTLAFEGPSSWERRTAQGEFSVRAGSGIAVQTAPDGTPQRVRAEGGARVWVAEAGAPGGPTHLAGETLVVDRASRELTARGHALVERAGAEPPLRLSAVDHLLVRTDEQDQPRWVEADGGVACTSGEYELSGDSLRWDMEADQAVLAGHCRLLANGAWMSAERVELSPRAQMFRILRATLHVQG